VPGTAATGVHVVTVSLRGAHPPVWRRQEIPNGMMLDQVHEALHRTFDWEDFYLHALETTYGGFGRSSGRGPWSLERRSASHTLLALVDRTAAGSGPSWPNGRRRRVPGRRLAITRMASMQRRRWMYLAASRR
jgi:hypothetical protein